MHKYILQSPGPVMSATTSKQFTCTTYNIFGNVKKTGSFIKNSWLYLIFGTDRTYVLHFNDWEIIFFILEGNCLNKIILVLCFIYPSCCGKLGVLETKE